MPAWPAQGRDDEVWAQVAFLRALPDMTAATYADLALGGGVVDDDLEAGGQALAALDGIFENALENCARCHGRDGLGRGDRTAEGAFPIIAGQPAPYLNATLLAFAQGRRESGFMQPPASRYDAQTLAELQDPVRRPPALLTPLPDPVPTPRVSLPRHLFLHSPAFHLFRHLPLSRSCPTTLPSDARCGSLRTPKPWGRIGANLAWMWRTKASTRSARDVGRLMVFGVVGTCTSTASCLSSSASRAA